MVNASDRARLVAQLSERHLDLITAEWQLEQSARKVPSVEEAEWQGPARGIYEYLLANLRRTLADAVSEIQLARRETRAAIQTLQS